MTEQLLFVCSGNITRSPIAAALADRVALELSLEVEIRSASSLGIAGQPAYPQMVSAGREMGLDLSRHRSQPLTASLCQWASHIAVMQLIHSEAVLELDPSCSHKVVQLGPLVGAFEIEDPTGSWFPSAYRQTRDQLGRAVRKLMLGLAQGEI